VVERLLESLSALQDPLWLVIDDLHELRSSEALRQLEMLITRGPSHLRFVLATRHSLRLGLHRLRLEGEVTEIHAADLRFSVGEARALLDAAGTELPDSAVTMLHARTEGWAAGLRLAALSLAGHPDPERFAAEFSGSERTVAEYLLAEVLERQSGEVWRLLLRTSVLERVCGPLADLLTGGSGGLRILQDLEDAGAFVLALDGQRSWFRYHSLFADLLRQELTRTEPDTLPALHRTAAAWYADYGYPVEAVRHAQAAQDWELAACILSDSFFALVLDGRESMAHELLAGFPADIVAADAELTVLAAADELYRGSVEAAERYLARAGSAIASVPASRRANYEVDLALLRLSVAQRRGDLKTATKEAERLLVPAAEPDAAQQLAGARDDLRALALVTLGTAELWALRYAEAERHLEHGVAVARRIGRVWVEVTGLAHGAWAVSFRSFGQAAERSTQAIKLAGEHGWSEQPAVAVAYAALGAIRVWQMRLEEAEGLLKQAERALQAEAEPAAGLVFHQARGMLELARGRDADALAAFQTAERLAGLLVTGHPRPGPMRAQMLLTLIRLGERGRAEAVIAALDDTERGEIRIALAALRLSEGDPRAATVALAPVLDGSAAVTNRGWATQAFLLEAIARDALGEPDAAGPALQHALDLAEPDGTLLAFVLNPCPDLLMRHARRHETHEALIYEILRLLSEPDGDRGAVSRPAIPPATQLTPAEASVLRYLPTNLPAPEIAAELSLSVNTIRTHMRHVYEKFGAHSRSEAVKRARARGLL
jgi:LuxR family maltose regulon positive regulatory protein